MNLDGVASAESPPRGRLATERADQACDATGVRRLRRDGIALLAGTASYPIPRQLFRDMPAEGDLYCLWRIETCDWLRAQFGDHLHSVVEHSDEAFQHLHFYVVPALRPDRCLNLHKIHPGRRMKADAVEAGAGKRVQDAAYRSGMSRWQNVYRYEVSRRFGHDRFGPRRRRVSRMQRQMEKRMEEAKARQAAALAAGIAAFERTQAVAQAETEREVTREFKLEAVRLIKERGVSFAQASQDLSVHEFASAQLGEGVCGRPAICLSGSRADEARTAAFAVGTLISERPYRELDSHLDVAPQLADARCRVQPGEGSLWRLQGRAPWGASKNVNFVLH